jgi:hypothetical protein
MLWMAPEPCRRITTKWQNIVVISPGFGGEGRHEDSRGSGSTQSGRRLHVVNDEPPWFMVTDRENHAPVKVHFKAASFRGVGQFRHNASSPTGQSWRLGFINFFLEM